MKRLDLLGDHHDDERFADWVDDRMDAEDRAAFEAELARNPRLRARLDAYVTTVGLVRKTLQRAPEARVRAPVDFVAQVMAATPRQRSPVGWWVPLVASAVAAGFLVAAFLWFRELQTAMPAPAPQMDVAMGDAEVPRDELRAEGGADGEAPVRESDAARTAERADERAKAPSTEQGLFGRVRRIGSGAPPPEARPIDRANDADGGAEPGAFGGRAGEREGARVADRRKSGDAETTGEWGVDGATLLVAYVAPVRGEAGATPAWLQSLVADGSSETAPRVDVQPLSLYFLPPFVGQPVELADERSKDKDEVTGSTARPRASRGTPRGGGNPSASGPATPGPRGANAPGSPTQPQPKPDAPSGAPDARVQLVAPDAPVVAPTFALEASDQVNLLRGTEAELAAATRRLGEAVQSAGGRLDVMLRTLRPELREQVGSWLSEVPTKDAAERQVILVVRGAAPTATGTSPAGEKPAPVKPDPNKDR